MSVCMHKHTCVHPHTYKICLDIIQIKFYLTVLTMSFFFNISLSRSWLLLGVLHYVTNCLPEWKGQSLYRAAFSCYAAPQTFTFILLPSSSGMPFPGHLQWAVQTWSVMWQILRTVGTCHQIPGGTLSVCSFLCTALSLQTFLFANCLEFCSQLLSGPN